MIKRFDVCPLVEELVKLRDVLLIFLYGGPFRIVSLGFFLLNFSKYSKIEGTKLDLKRRKF